MRHLICYAVYDNNNEEGGWELKNIVLKKHPLIWFRDKLAERRAGGPYDYVLINFLYLDMAMPNAADEVQELIDEIERFSP